MPDAPRRTDLEKVLAEAASAAGDEISDQTTLEALRTHDTSLCSKAISSVQVMSTGRVHQARSQTTAA